ncbi:MAG: zinc ribbon domain-containing protein [Cyclobacteriaceae bacterium]
MKKKECPSCAMDVDASAKECPICNYEFNDHPVSYKWIAFILALLLLLYFVL